MNERGKINYQILEIPGKIQMTPLWSRPLGINPITTNPDSQLWVSIDVANLYHNDCK